MSRKPGRVRIISGEWRGRFIPIPTGVELRPTTDRIRETLFNWIAPHIEGARCLDVCSGSGILAFEALSRGAAHVTAVDNERRVTQHLQEQSNIFNTTQLEVILSDVVTYLSQPATQTFDIVFVDPPFAAQLWEPICQQLSQQSWLAPQALVYVEMPKQVDFQGPAGWEALKQKKAGNVKYELWTA